ncbi:hypothetical protein N2152v2_006760 [Parachlorella kessleri]
MYKNQTGEVAVDFYHRFAEAAGAGAFPDHCAPMQLLAFLQLAHDIELMKSLGIRNFRMSLAWPRLFPNGTGKVNQAGVDYYNKVINMLRANCIEPHVTLYHWDLPQALQDRYGGWLSPKIVGDFAFYAAAAFQLFGDRVKYWTTINEPFTVCVGGYGVGTWAPGRCSDRKQCKQGNSVTEPPRCAYHVLLAHAAAVPHFRRLVPDGKISIVNAVYPFHMPLTNSKQDVDAAERLNRWTSGQFLDPLFTGQWTPERQQMVPSFILPRFTPEQSAALKAAKPDFLAINFYSGKYAYQDNASLLLRASTTTVSAAGVPLPQAESTWLYAMPEAMRGLLVWLDRRYNLPIIITENGVSVPKEDSLPREEALCDTYRVDYYRDYIGNATLAVVKDGVRLLGYTAWSLQDCLEWAEGYEERFGIVYVDYTTQKRYLKASALWLANLFGLTSARSAAEVNAQQGTAPRAQV